VARANTVQKGIWPYRKERGGFKLWARSSSSDLNFIKVLTVSRHIRQWTGAREILIRTSQLYDAPLSAEFFETFRIPASHIDPIVGSSLAAQLGRIPEFL
jgi:hypothetical protein